MHILRICQVDQCKKKHDLGWESGRHPKEEKCIQGFGGET
jgi:hypothetical protein